MGRLAVYLTRLGAVVLGLFLLTSFMNAEVNAAPKVSGELIIGFGAESNVLDVTKAAAGVDWYYDQQFYEMLIQADPKLERKNWLAESWTLGQEGGNPVIDVKLRKGVKLHNGDTCVAKDWVYCYERMKDPKISKWSHYQAAVDRLEVIDDYHFKIHFKKPDATYIPGGLRLYGISKAYFDKVGDDGVQNHPVGTGPWKFVSRNIKEDLKLEAFDQYWNKTQRPGVKNLTIKVIPEDMTRVAAFKTGEIDWIDAVPPAMITDVKAMKGVQTVSLLSGNNLFLQFNTHMPNSPFKDVRVRLAAAYAIDMDGIIKSVLFGQGERYASVGKGTLGYDPKLKPYEYNPEKAKKLLVQAGYPNGFDIPFYNLITPREPNIKEYGEAVAAYLTAAGIRCKIEGLEYAPWIAMGARQDPPDMDGIVSWMWGHGVVGDPGSPWAGYLHCYKEGTGWGSYSYWCDPEFDKLLEQSQDTMDPVKREVLLKKIGRLKFEKVAGGLDTYRPLVTFAWRTDKVTYTPWPGAYYRELREIGLKKK
jgi:peptide/nickel transport system substrate-binding protein